MNNSRDVLQFLDTLTELRKKQTERLTNYKETDIDLSLEGKNEVTRYLNQEVKYSDLTIEAAMYCVLESQKENRKNPFFYSNLVDYLEMETWTPKDAFLILAGVDPMASIMDWSYENFMGAQIDEPKIRHANCFSDLSDLYDYPIVDDYKYSSSELKRMIELAKKNGSTDEQFKELKQDLHMVETWEKDETSIFKTTCLELRSTMVGILKKRWDSGEHETEKRYSPEHFISWAEKRGFEIEWAIWARKQSFLSDSENASAAPYFDADAVEYPELLHIAVRAWEYAKANEGGTPKQRVVSYLDARYPSMTNASKEAIAVLVNWKKSGGRPVTGG